MFNQQTNEETLIRGCLAGDRRAMEAFYKRFFPSLFPVARRYARDEQEARSLFNTAMLKAFQGLSAFESARSIYPWLKTIVIRTGLDHLRAQFRRQISAELDAASEVYVDESAADWLDAEAVQLLIGQLPALTRTVFNLFPKHEMYELGSQLRRSSDSVPTNIVEGYGRKKYKADFVKFLTYSYASCLETVFHIEK